MKNYLFTLVALVAFSVAVNAQNKKLEELPLPHKVTDLELVDLYGKASKLPMWGQKNLLIFLKN